MLTAISNKTKYISKISTYILHVSDCLINRQKTIVNVIGIKPFFDVIEISLFIFKTKLVKILSNIFESISKFRIVTISAFSL